MAQRRGAQHFGRSDRSAAWLIGRGNRLSVEFLGIVMAGSIFAMISSYAGIHRPDAAVRPPQMGDVTIVALQYLSPSGQAWEY
jgi:hypothetical protein